MTWLGFYDANQQALWSYALSLTGTEHDAADLVHDVMVSMIRVRRAPEHALAYVLRAMRNRAIDARRRERRAPRLLRCDPKHQDRVASETQASRLLARLSPDEAEIVILRLRSGLEFDAIARVVQRPRGTVSSTYTRAIEKLRRVASEESHEP